MSVPMPSACRLGEADNLPSAGRRPYGRRADVLGGGAVLGMRSPDSDSGGVVGRLPVWVVLVAWIAWLALVMGPPWFVMEQFEGGYRAFDAWEFISSMLVALAPPAVLTFLWWRARRRRKT
jgi:hypothetical protein